MEALDRRVTLVETAINKLMAEHNRKSEGMSMADEDRAAYEQQIRVLREDFHQEREDRERMAYRNEALELRLEKLQKEYTALECQLTSMQNNRAYGLSRLQKHPFYANDDGSDQTFNTGMDISPAEIRR